MYVNIFPFILGIAFRPQNVSYNKWSVFIYAMATEKLINCFFVYKGVTGRKMHLSEDRFFQRVTRVDYRRLIGSDIHFFQSANCVEFQVHNSIQNAFASFWDKRTLRRWGMNSGVFRDVI